MKLNVTFESAAAATKFQTKTGELDLANVAIGLINLIAKDPTVTACEVTGDPIMFHVLFNGAWTEELVADPFTRIKAGEVMEPAAAPIKMLSVDPSFTLAQNRIANRYQPLVSNPYYADFTSQREVQIILIDSGVNLGHSEFAHAAIDSLYKVPRFDNTGDDVGHGTELASLLVGKNLGVNPSAKLKVVKISGLNDKPTLAELGDAIDAVYDYHMTTPSIPKVVNMSWLMPASLYISQKLQRLADAGLLLVAAAGNTTTNIDDITPGGLSFAFTVAASKLDDHEFANVYGVNKKIDIYAPGQDVGVVDFTNNVDYKTVSGSSASAALTSGVASMLFGIGGATPTANDVRTAIYSDATFNCLTLGSEVSLAENKLLHRPDTTSLAIDRTQYLGTLTTDLTMPRRFNLRPIVPAAIFSNSPTFTFAVTNPADNEYVGTSTITFVDTGSVNDECWLNLQITPGCALPGDEKVRLIACKVTATIDGMAAETSNCWLAVTSPTASATELMAAMTAQFANTPVAGFSYESCYK